MLQRPLAVQIDASLDQVCIVHFWCAVCFKAATQFKLLRITLIVALVPDVLITCSAADDRFQQWPSGSAGVTVINCSSPKLYCGAAGTCEPGHGQLLRGVWDGDDAAITVIPNPFCVKVNSMLDTAITFLAQHQ